MNPDNPIPPSVHWSEGMLLMPQHFQQQDRHHEELLRYHLNLLSPFHWGVKHLDYDPHALATGVFSIKELEAVLPDGLVVHYPPSPGPRRQALPLLTLKLEGLQDLASKQPVRIHLAVSDDKRSGTSSPHSRFLAQGTGPVTDEHTGEGDAHLTVLVPNLKLQADNEVDAGYTRLPLIAVEFVQNKFGVVASYVAPRLTVARSSRLGQRCTELVQELRGRAASLEDSIRNVGRDTERALLQERERLLHHLVAGLPAFEALLSTDPPTFTLYLGLCSLAGQMAAVGHSRLPPSFEPYEHMDPHRSFGAVIDFIRTSLNEGVSDLFSAIPLQQAKDLFSATLEPDWLDREWVLGIQGTPGTTEQQLQDWIRGARIGPEDQLKGLREKRSVGLLRTQVNQCRGLLAPRGTLLFSLTPERHLLDPRQPLAVENTRDPEHPRPLPRPAQLTLFIGPRLERS